MVAIQGWFPAARGVAGTTAAATGVRGWADLALLAGILGLFVLLQQGGVWLRMLDPVAAPVDLGALSLPLLAAWSLLVFLAVARWLLGLLWPVFRDFRKHHFEPIFKSLRPWQKIILYLCCFFLLLYAFVACLAAVC